MTYLAMADAILEGRDSERNATLWLLKKRQESLSILSNG